MLRPLYPWKALLYPLDRGWRVRTANGGKVKIPFPSKETNTSCSSCSQSFCWISSLTWRDSFSVGQNAQSKAQNRVSDI